MAILSFLLMGLVALFSSQVEATANPNVAITVHNNITTGKDAFVYIAGYTDPSGSQSMLQTDSTWALLDAGASITPVKIPFNVEFLVPASASLTLTLPSYVNSSRLYVVEGARLPWEMVAAASGHTTVVQPVPTTPGTAAHDARWGFVEFTSEPDEFFVNLSFVDFVSLPIGIAGTDATTGEVHVVPGLMQSIPGFGSSSSSSPLVDSDSSVTAANVTTQICADLEAQAVLDGNPWGTLCVYPNTTDASSNTVPLRILSPQSALQQNTPFVDPAYYDAYIAAVWSHYTTTPLYIDTQRPGVGCTTNTTSSSTIACLVDASTDHLVCSNTTRTMPRPSTADIWGCNSGAFSLAGPSTVDDDDDDNNNVFAALVPRLCAAFTRSTLLVDGGDVQPGPAVAAFYGGGGSPPTSGGRVGAGVSSTTTTTTTMTTNHFARVVHAREVMGGYAFSYDDVGVAGAEAQNGAIQVGSMEALHVYVGG